MKLLPLFAAALLASHAFAQIPQSMNYQGRVAVSGVNFHGSGQFKFALVDEAGTTTFWSNDGTSTVGDEPATGVAINVVNGLYSVALADAALGMAVLDPAIFFNALSLRVWFDDGVHGFQLLTPDQRFGAVPYAFKAALALNVADGAIGGAQLADGAITSAKLAAGAVTIEQLNFTGAPNTGQVLGFDGANLTWLTAGGGGPGGGSLTLPFSGLQAAAGALFSINNSGAGADAWAIYGHSQTNLGVFGQTHGDAQSGVLGRNDGVTGAGGAGVFGYASTGGNGVLAISEGGNGLWATTNAANQAGVYAQTHQNGSVAARFNHFGNGTAVQVGAQGTGVRSVSQGAGSYGVLGEANGANGVGVAGYTGAANAHGAAGYAFGGGAGVYAFGGGGGSAGLSALSTTSDGVTATTQSASAAAVRGATSASGAFGIVGVSTQGTGVWGKSENANGVGGFFWNSAGGDGLRVTGRSDLFGDLTVRGTATVRALTISNGVDIAEPFAVRDDAEFPRGSVMVISDERPGELQLSHEEYDTRVAGIISGANGINPGMQLTQKGVNDVGGQPVALTGRVYCRADATFGAIKPGDLLTTSTTPGHARRVTDHTRSQGAVLGKAMSALPDGTGFVLVLVTLQ